MAPELTQDQIEQSERGPKFADVTPAQLFGPQADGGLAERVYRQNARRYYELREEHQYLIGAERRPDSHYE